MTSEAQHLVMLLFVTGEALSRKELQSLLAVTGEALERTVQEAQAALEELGLALVVTDESVELTTAPNMAEFLTAYLSEVPPGLTRAAAETLALVAYAGPLTRFEIDSLRGVDSRRMLRSLTRAGLVQRLPGRGRAALYSVSEEFLKGMGIQRREDLPRFQELAKNPALERLLGRGSV